MAENISHKKVITDRKERRIDYSREDIARILSLSPSGVDKKIKEIVQEYNLPETCFKREGEVKGRNFFPPEYTPLLMLIMKNDPENPLTMRDSKKKNVTADKIREYNERMIKDIRDGEPTKLNQELKEFIENMPWYRVSEDIVEWIDLLVEEIQELIYNLLTLGGNDLGQTMRYICREIDNMNYNLFRNHRLTNMIQEENNMGLAKLNKELQQDLNDSENGGKEPTDYFQNAYRESGGELQRVAVSDKSIDNGIISIMKAIMDGMGLEYIQSTMMDKLPQYYSAEERIRKEEEMGDISEDKKKRLVDEEEREEYLKEVLPGMLQYIDSFCHNQGMISIVNNNGVKWRSIPERIEEGVFEEDYREEYEKTCIYEKTGASYEEWEKIVYKPTPEQFKKICKDYLKHYNAVKNNMELREIVNHFVGQIIATYYNQ